jgi:tRNA wybutosine-synthesizing protein 1
LKAKTRIRGADSLTEAQRAKWGKSYGIVGRHSSVDVCEWTRKSLVDKGTCYKGLFYGIDTHRCAEMSPATAWCQERCSFCWRPMEWYFRAKMGKRTDAPKEIIEKTVEARKRLIAGFRGNPNANAKLVEESYSLFPSHWAISLSGEPTLYRRLPELVKALREHSEVKSIFIVSNGQEPEMLLKMKRMGALPTQLYISVAAPDRGLFRRINRSAYADGWERLGRTLGIVRRLKCRTVIRFTLIKGINDADAYLPLYAGLFGRSRADYIEIKAFMFLGQSRKRLKQENMPSHEDVRAFAKKLLKLLKAYKMQNEHALSRVVLLKRRDSRFGDRITQPDSTR